MYRQNGRLTSEPISVHRREGCWRAAGWGAGSGAGAGDGGVRRAVFQETGFAQPPRLLDEHRAQRS